MVINPINLSRPRLSSSRRNEPGAARVARQYLIDNGILAASRGTGNNGNFFLTCHAAFYRKTLVLANGGLGVYLFDDIEDHGDNDEERGAAYRERGDAGDALEDERQYGKYSEEEVADKRDASDDVGEVFGRLRAGTYARDERAVFLQVFCNLVRLK